MDSYMLLFQVLGKLSSWLYMLMRNLIRYQMQNHFVTLLYFKWSCVQGFCNPI